MSVTQQNISSLTQEWLREILLFFLRPVEIVRTYRKEDFRPDFIAAMTVAFIMLPQAIAYAMIAELPPQTGLYAAIVASIIGSLWGSSYQLHTGPTNAASLLVLSSLITIAAPGSPEYIAAAGLMAVLVGVVRLLMGIAKLGVLVNFVADSVIVGFTAGAGILIGANQLRHLLRLDIVSMPSFTETVLAIMANITSTHWPSFLVGVGTVGLIILLKKVRPKWPGPLMAMIAATAAVGIFGLDEQGVKVLGELPRNLPPLAEIPLNDWELINEMSTGVLAVSLIGLIEAMSIARSIAGQSGQRLDSNQEFVGQGLANIATGFLSGYTCSGSFTRSAVNYEAGARTALAAPISGLLVLLAMLIFGSLAAYLPRAAVAGILLVTVVRMVKVEQVKEIWRTSAGDTMIMIATLLATLFLPLEFAVLAGVMVAFIRYVAKTSTPNVRSMVPDTEFDHYTYEPEAEVCPQLGVLSIEGSLYFGATAHVEDALRSNLEEYPEQRFLLLRMQRVNLCDVSGLHMLETIVRLYRQREGDVFMVGVRAAVWEKMQASGFDKTLGVDHFLSTERAVEHIFYNVLDPGVCIYDCPIRVWKECQTLPKSQRDVNLPSGIIVPLSAVIPTITPTSTWEKLARGENGVKPLVIDVRERSEFEGGHIPQVRLVEMPHLLNKSTILPQDREIILVCRSGRRSTQVTYALQEDGYQKVFNMDGGMIAWQAAGLPVVIE
jgi:SulP family sulfate permease